MADCISKKERELDALREKAVTTSQVYRFEENYGNKVNAGRTVCTSYPQGQMSSPRQLIVTTSKDSQDSRVQCTSQGTPCNGARQTDLVICTEEDGDELSTDYSSDSTTSAEFRNGPFVYTRNGNEEGPVSPLSNGGDWHQTSPKSQSDTSRKSPRTKIPQQRVTPSNSSVPSALLGVVFETAEEELVFEILSDGGSTHPPTRPKCRQDTDSLSDEPLFFHDITLTPSVDLEQQEVQTPTRRSPCRTGIFTFEHPKVTQGVKGEESERSSSFSRSSWRYLFSGEFLQLPSPTVRYETMLGDNRHEHSHNESTDIKLETMTTSSAELELNVSVAKSTVCCRALRAVCWMLTVAITLGTGVVGILLLTTEVLHFSPTSDVLSDTPPANEKTSNQDLFLTIIGSLSGFDSLNDHSTPAYQAYRWMTTRDEAQLDPRTSSYTDIIERYIASLLFFAMDGNYWKNDFLFLSEKTICEWNGMVVSGTAVNKIPQGIQCNSDGRVVRIDLPQNNITGTLPWELAGLEALQVLRAPRNSVMGRLPAQLGLLADLRFVDLTNNHITGTLPTEFGWLRRMRQIKLRLNSLTGMIPKTFAGMSHLKLFDVSNNQMTGTLPPELGNLTALEYLDVSHNQLDGTVPSTLSGRSFTMLDVSFNNFTGNLDSEFCSSSHTTSFVWADCGGEDSIIQCSCCVCCDEYSGCDHPVAASAGK
ncbi:two component regulator [Nitzschia inconspicua]|uniref:Two component regulator n=1 Tax=Nitzschia inconspicua TaxID=303405 RepID=A0A9K3PKQ9_9STRA|nr:two component regulator [Nitzschia inconspicua]